MVEPSGTRKALAWYMNVSAFIVSSCARPVTCSSSSSTSRASIRSPSFTTGRLAVSSTFFLIVSQPTKETSNIYFPALFALMSKRPSASVGAAATAVVSFLSRRTVAEGSPSVTFSASTTLPCTTKFCALAPKQMNANSNVKSVFLISRRFK